MEALLDELNARSVRAVTAPPEAWQDRLRQLANATLVEYCKYPSMAVESMVLTTQGRGELDAIELMLDAFTRAELEPDEVVRHYALLASRRSACASPHSKTPNCSHSVSSRSSSRPSARLIRTRPDSVHVEAARKSERRYAEGTARALEGVPLMFKEEQPIAGRLLEEGSLFERGTIADETHPIVERIFAPGAVVHGRTTTPEFSCAPVTHSALWGVTRNPNNLACSPGGSSGGSGAVLAAGSTILATGSDIGCSIRIPSSYCGVVGFKPPFGRVPGMAPFNSDTYCADGPMGRSVADVAMLQNVMVGPWSGDQASLRPALRVSGNMPEDGLRGTRIALSITLGGYSPDPDVVRNTLEFADALRAAGAIVDEVDLPWTIDQVQRTAWAHFGAVMGPFIESVEGGDPVRASLLMPYTRAFAASAASSGSYAEGLLAEAAFSRPLGELLERYDALLCPTIANIGLAADAECVDSAAVFSELMTLPFNIVGRVPVLALPSGRARNGVPTGVQLVGRSYDDETVFRIGAAVEAELALWTEESWWSGIAV